MTRVRIDNLSKQFGAGAGATRALDEVNIEIATGEFFFLLGPSGCGKTTLLRTIAGMIEPTAGRVWFDDDDVTQVSVEKRRTALVFQNYALWPHMTIRDNVAFGPKMQKATRAEQRARAAQNLARIQMAEYALRKPNQLSGGQQQRVALARALAAQPKVLLLDEPLSNLDAQLRLHMRTELLGLVKSSHMTAIYVTHDQKEALSMADRIAVMHQGRVVQVGAPEELYGRPATRFIAGFLGEANLIAGEVAANGAGVKVRTAAGELAVAEGRGHRPGDKVVCCVRPERIRALTRPDATAPPQALTLEATVVQNIYLGESRQLFCDLGRGITWKVTTAGDTAAHITTGSPLRLALTPEDVVIVADD